MVKSKPVIIVLFVGVISIIVFCFFFQTEERQVRKRFKIFTQTASKHAKDSQLIVAGKSKKISTFFAQTCQIEAREYNVSKDYTQQNVRTIAFHVLTRYSKLDLKFIDLKIDIPEKGIATAVSTARIIGKVKGTEKSMEENHEIDCRLRKIDDEWVFEKVELIDVLKK